MKKLISIALIVLSLGLQLFAGVPSWTVNPSDYSNSMVMVGTINLDGVESVDENDMIAAFIDGEVRGVANIKFEAVANRYLAYMLIYSNESSGDITFKMYDADQDVALDLQNTTNFTINGLIGNVASPHIWSDVFLNTGSEITTFGILEIVDEVDIDSQTINIAIGIADDITDLVATFRVSEGARVTVDNTAQTSGITTNDFTDPVVYTVTSENGDNSTIYTVMVSIINNPPADLALSALAINENNEVNAVIGAFTVDDDEVNHDFSMVNGEGSEDNGLFDILNDELISMQILDFEDRSSYSIRVAVTDSASQTLEKSFSINVNDINESPTDIALEMGTVGEHSLAGIVVGVLSSSDPDAGDIFSYSIGSSTDDSFFSVSGNNLELAQSLDYETQASYSVELIVTDIGENTYAKTFTIDISDENDAPTSISLDSESVYENVSFGTVIGNLTAADQDADDVQIFSLAAGTGDTDNSLVIVAGNRLLLNSTIDFETNNTMAIRLKVEDATTDSFEQEFLIEILDANDSPIDFLLSNILVPENQADGFVVGELTVVDTDPTTMTYTFITGQNDNGYFALDGTQLITVGSFDFELQDELLIDVLATDIDNQSIVNRFTIEVSDVNEAPTVVSALADINIEQNTNTELYVASYFEDVDKDDELMLSISVLGRENLPGGLEFDDVANIVSINSLIEIPSFDIVLTASDMGGLTASDTIRVEVDVVTGIEEEFSKLSVFPNPTERTLYLSNPYAMNLNSSQLTIINLNGSDQTKNATFYYNEIDVSNLKKGVYFLKIIEQDKTRYIRFVRK